MFSHLRIDGVCFKCVIALIEIAVFISTALVIYWLADSSPPLTILQPGKIDTSVVHPGDTLTVRQSIHKTRMCAGGTVRYITGDCGEFALYVGPPLMTFSVNGEVTVRAKIPEEASPGACFYNTHVFYTCNPIQYLSPLTIDFPPIPFVVAAKEP